MNLLEFIKIDKHNNKPIKLKRESYLSTSMKGRRDELDNIVIEKLKKLRKLNEANQRSAKRITSNLLESSNKISDINMETTVTETVIPNISTSNMFSNLSNLPDKTGNIQFESTQAKTVQLKVPPIVVQNKNYNEITDILSSLGVLNYSLKMMSIGIKISISNIDVYNNLLRDLKSNEIQFYTFNQQQNKPLKVVLSGLPETNTTEIKNAIIAKGILAADIIEIISLKSKDDNRTFFSVSYLVKFNALKVNFGILRNIKFINNVVVKWFPYTNIKRGPTQCRNCQMYGHGTSFCYKTAKCFKCGENHSTTDCSKLDTDPEKCANCNGNHKSNYKECPAISNYQMIRENINLTNKITRLTNNKKINPAISLRSKMLSERKSLDEIKQFSVKDFPSMPAVNLSEERNNFFSQFSGQKRSSQQRFQQGNSSQQLNSQQNSLGQNECDNQHTSELFSYDEMLSLINELVSSISICRTRAEQFQVITKLSIKYIYQNGK